MKSLQPLLILTILLFQTTLLAQKTDLTVLEIADPEIEELDPSVYGTRIVVTIQNSGKVDLENVKIRVWDLDISLEEGKEKWGIGKSDYWILEENEGRSENSELDYDEDWELIQTVDLIKKGKKVELTFIVNHWIYDSNCEIGVAIDPDNLIEESNENNNTLGYFAGG